MPSVLHLILGLAFSASPASPAGWKSLTDKVHPDCSIDTPCRIVESTAVFEIMLPPAIKKGMKSLHEVQIKGLKAGTIEKYKVNEIKDINADEHFDIQKIELNGQSGLALHAYNSAREGKVYYYFLYDKAKQKYVMSEGTFPKLTWNAKAKAFVTPVAETKYVIDKNQKIVGANGRQLLKDNP